jgi:RNA polymerase sigma-70 factor, ECF subfamily
MSKRKTKIAENDLLDMLKTRSEKGFAILYDNYSAALFGVVKRVIDDNDLASDVTQDSFVKIWKNFDQYNTSKGTLFTWMINIARNTAIDCVRSQAYIKGKVTDEIENNVGTIDSQQNLTQYVDAIGLKALVEKLKPEQKQLIDLVYFKGYTQSEIAEEFDIPRGTIKTRIKSAINSLRGQMALAITLLLTLILKY